MGLAWRMAVWCLVAGSARGAEPVALTWSTNQPPATNALVRHRLELTKEQARLNGSQFFLSEVNDFKKRTSHELKGNEVEPAMRPAACLNAMVFNYEDGARECFLTVSLSSSRYRDWADIGTNVLELIIDGSMKVQATPGREWSFFHHDVLTADDVVVVESETYRVSEEVIRSIAAARRAQFRIRGEKGSVQRNLDATNLRRFQVFAATFLDGR